MIETQEFERSTRSAVTSSVDRALAFRGEPLGITDTIARGCRQVVLDEEKRERERILSPDAAGVRGGPYKMLRTQVLQRLKELHANTLAVLSATEGDGKTLTAINLAIAVAADFGHTSLLVDLDLRNPSVHHRLGLAPNLGIEDCVEQRRPVHEALIKLAGYKRLTVLPARVPIKHSSELVAAAHMSEIVQELRTRYANRILIFDLPPVLATDDALAFSQQIQAGLFVVAEGKTAREDIAASLALLRNLPIIGTVLNRSRDGGGAYYARS
jgi:Mrp family chromosome partitioning ATPase